jgi:hypothetical protein
MLNLVDMKAIAAFLNLPNSSLTLRSPFNPTEFIAIKPSSVGAFLRIVLQDIFMSKNILY